jgi:hypothetical protein
MEFKPKDEIIDAWIAALRSGEYPQGRSVLRRDGPWQDKFCCLGVLCEIAGLPKELQGNAYIYKAGDRPLDKSTTQLPLALAEHLGMTIAGYIPSREGMGSTSSLMGENDASGASFAAIADIIERHRAEIFTVPIEKIIRSA